MRAGTWLGILLLLAGRTAFASAPILFSQPAYESPVRGAPGDLLLLAGTGFSATNTVVYQQIADTTQPLTPPAQVPASSTTTSGIMNVVSSLDAPDSLTVSLPTSMQTDVSYAVWVVDDTGEWSNGILINDARPLWVTPDTVYTSAAMATLPRAIKIVGRNLQPAPGAVTQVQLCGPGCITLTAANDNDPTTAIETYVAKVDLPDSLPPGTYSVQVNRDGTSWTTLSGRNLTVRPDPTQPVTFAVGGFGCLPDDGADDTACIASAIAAAKANGGGVVTFGPGVWDMNYAGARTATGPVTNDGVLIPVGVDLQGSTDGTSTIRRGTSWNAAIPSFSLQGNNAIQDLTFSDANIYQATSTAAPPLRLGVKWSRATAYKKTDPATVSGITITRNTFAGPFIAVGDGGMPVDHLLITNNEFGAYATALSLIGDGGNFKQPFVVADSVIAYNTFEPGSYSNPSIGQGAIASQVGAGLRLDFSNNITDGTSTKYLYDPVNDAHGWRAGHFFAQRGNHETVLVSQNNATCTGDNAGDGEAITTDGSNFTVGLAAAQNATAATSNTVTLPGPLLLTQGGSTLPGAYFVGHWVAIVAGPGKGQVRKILSYPLDSSGQPVTPLTLTVYPAWDVVPQSTSTIVISRESWQFYIVDNFVDQRQPLCTKGNQNEPSGGRIGFYSQTADSVIEGNQQYDTSGINLGLKYSVTDSTAGTTVGMNLDAFVDVRQNTVTGEYDWASSCSWSGIQLTDGASPTPAAPPPVESYGISISHNTITHADGLHGGAIALTRGWYAGPSPGNWNLEDNTLVFANSINNVSGAASQAMTSGLPYTTSAYQKCSNVAAARIGINALDATMWRTVLSGNACNNVATNLSDAGTATVRAFQSIAASSCDVGPN